MTVSRIEIEQIKGVEHVTLNLAGKSLVVIRGSNGTGKSSILDAISSIFEGGSDPSLIRQGAKSGRVRIELSDGKVIDKQQTAKGATLKVTDQNGEQVDKPQTFVDSLAASFSFDPLGFIRADKKKRADFAAQHANLTFTGKEIGALKIGKFDVAAVLRDLIGPNAKLDLDAFDKLRKTVYERRRTANGAVAELDKTVANLRRSLPAEVEQGVTGEDVLIIKRGELLKLEVADKADYDLIDKQVGEAKGEAQDAFATARAENQQVYEAAVAEARLVYDELNATALKVRDITLADIAQGETEARATVEAARKTQKEEIQRAIGEAEGNLKRTGEIKALSAHLEEQRDRLSDKMAEAEKLDEALAALDELKKSRFDKFPVSGVTFKDGECFRDDIPFDQLNKQRQVVTAMEIGCLGMGELPFFVIDEGENFDETNLESVCKDLEASGVQVVITVVSDGPLRAEPQGSLLTS